MASCRSLEPSPRPGPTGSASRRSTRRSTCGQPGSGRRSSSCTRSRQRWQGRLGGSGSRSLPATTSCWRRPSPARPRSRIPPCSTCSSRSRRASGVAASPWTTSSRRPGRSRAHGSARLAGLWTHLQAAEDAARTAAQLARFEEAAAALAGGRDPDAPRHLAASGGLLVDGVASYDAVRPGLAAYGIVPEELLEGPGGASPAHRRGRGRAFGRCCRFGRARFASRTCRQAGGSATARRSPRRDPAGSRRCRSATATAGPGPSRIAPKRWFAAGGCRSSATWPWMPSWPTSRTCPGPRSSAADEFVLIGVQGSDRITATEVAAARATNSWEVVTDLSARLPRVYHAASVPRELRTLAGHSANPRRSMRP